MAAATVTGRQQNVVMGSLRRIGASSIVFASNGDTWTIPGLKVIKQIDLTSTTGVAYGFTIAGNVITLASAGGLTFGGGVLGT